MKIKFSCCARRNRGTTHLLDREVQRSKPQTVTGLVTSSLCGAHIEKSEPALIDNPNLKFIIEDPIVGSRKPEFFDALTGEKIQVKDSSNLDELKTEIARIKKCHESQLQIIDPDGKIVDVSDINKTQFYKFQVVVNSEITLELSEYIQNNLSLINQLKDIFEKFRGVTSVTIDEYGYRPDQKLFGDEEIRLLADRFPNIESIKLVSCVNITDSGIKYLSEKCKNLVYVTITEANKLSDTSVIDLTKNCPNIKYLDLTECESITDKSLEYMKECTSVCLSGCIKVTDDGLKHLKKVTSLDLSYIENITTCGLKNLSPGVLTLNISRCDIDDTSFKYLSKVQFLCISECEGRVKGSGFRYLNDIKLLVFDYKISTEYLALLKENTKISNIKEISEIPPHLKLVNEDWVTIDVCGD